jgi:uncharacterized membrane protein
LIYFIHHVSISIHIGEIIHRVQHELLAAIDEIFPEMLGQEHAENPVGRKVLAAYQQEQAATVLADTVGYVQAVDDDKLLGVAKSCELVVQLLARPGDFIVPGQALLHVWPADRADQDTRDRLRRCLVTGQQRTPVQDILFAFKRQADIAVRALSPGINDPLTAMDSLDHLGDALIRLAEREFPDGLRYDDQHHLRVIATPVEYRLMVECSIGLIREYARSSVAVTLKVLEILERVARRAGRPGDREALAAQLHAIVSDPFPDLNPHDLARLRSAQEQARSQLARGGPLGNDSPPNAREAPAGARLGGKHAQSGRS